ncbi:60S large subunit ribosomal protein uL4 (rpL4) [Andalucia godoyi]|uniref:60S large subunit ribosomal protein uL4 (RpL4) n=1 Tax=Andalucia godoyi TaxID=505711 RepID=A0A8K0AHQ1_ANDGO|nr:60S large subunit ribosomal protein uL4 (rpL4) [Andalucia godoyi]WCZ58507.1 60S ribosomal protein L4 [Andalucia godoyi]|eukprot:ANDGO_03131.mRNA.1 60S large subunit ribosomal protein uL4 (rpL4)
MSILRPVITVFGTDGKKTGSLTAPAVFSAPIRNDVVHFVHTNMAKNKRQPYAVMPISGAQTSAESWGTGRAVARIPRVGGGGTHRSGEGAFGNMCRGGRMFGPNKVWRRWHRRINVNQKRVAVASALSASAVVPLVMARGHRVENVPEVPLVVSSEIEKINKTAAAVKILKALGAYDEVEKVVDTRRTRAGQGKMRSRRYVVRKGPLVVYKEDNGVVRAFRNIPGVEVACVDRLNLLQLAPGGHLGRFVIWTESAAKHLGSLFGTFKSASLLKNGFKLPQPAMINADLARIINSDEIQSKVRIAKPKAGFAPLKKNPLRNRGALYKLNPYARFADKVKKQAEQKSSSFKASALEARRAGKPIKGSGVAKKLAKFRATRRAGSKNFLAQVSATLTAQ